MESSFNLKWTFNGTPIADSEKVSFFNSYSSCDLKTKDIHFCHLNEIDPNLLDIIDDIQLFDDDIVDEIIDPRNNEAISCTQVDHSDKGRYQKRLDFYKKFPQSSALSRQEHFAIGYYLRSRMKNVEPRADDVKIFEETKEKRNREYRIYEKFVKNYFLANPSNHLKEFESLYKHKLQLFAENLSSNFRKTYTLETAIPLLNSLQPNYEIDLQLDPTFLQIHGNLPLYKDYFDLYKIKTSTRKYFNNLNENTNFNPNSLQESDMTNECETAVHVSERALAYLLTLCTDSLCEAEIPLEIQENQICIGTPLPCRQMNCDTNLVIFETLARNYITINHQNALVTYQNGSYAPCAPESSSEIDAIDLKEHFAPSLVENYLKSSEDDVLPTTSRITSKIVLKNNNDDCQNVFIHFDNLGFASDSCDIKNISYKLEYKKKFGLERMTSNELITEYIRNEFIPRCKTIRYRIDFETFEVLLALEQSKIDIATELQQQYAISISNLMSKLHQFIQLLKNFPEGNYLLVYNLNFNDKFMVYGQSNRNDDAKKISISSLFENCTLTAQTHFIPIDTMQSSVIHDNLNIIPGCFPPWGKKRTATLTNDREKIVKKAQDKKEAIEKCIKAKQNQKRVAKRAAKRLKQRRQNKQKKAEQVDESSMEEEDKCEQLVEKYSNVKDKISNDYVSLHENAKVQTKVKDDFNLEEYLLTASNVAGVRNVFTREDYLKQKQNLNNPSLHKSPSNS